MNFRSDIPRATAGRLWMALALCLTLLSACATTGGEHDDISICCTHAERIPAPVVDAVKPAAPVVGRLIGHTVLRDGYLRDDEAARTAILHDLRPLDLVVVSSKGRLSGHTIPGLFGHAAVYMGTEAELVALGLWNDARVKPHRDIIRSGKLFIEADQDGVHFSSPARVLNTDRAVVLRPALSPAERRRAAHVFLDAIGTPFDFRFSIDTPECVFCTELVAHAMPSLPLAIDTIYRTRLIFPDRLVHAALVRPDALKVVSYTRGTSAGVARATSTQLRRDLAGYWAGTGTKP